MATASSSSDPTPLEVPPWLKSLPLAPEYHPTLAEFQDPISFILKIEKQASSYGICKIIPPLPPPPKKPTLANLNRSFAARDPSPKKPPTFTTRQQQIGFCPRRPRPVQKPVWQSGETYTLQQFEAKAKQFERAQMKRFGKKNPFLPLEVESLFWGACADKPFSVEYANDMPGSGFVPIVKKWCKEEEAGNVGESGWNMRGVSRAKGSLLRFMKEEVPGVTSPMVYVAMMYSWFAWHVEDHELHSLNYLHMGASKTWYGVPRDAGQAFEEVVRVHGYSGEVNPLVTFTILGEKTTVMSPEVLIGAGIPCCRLVQNAGEFVVTFPGAYHCGFSHGFNCAEAANIATPGWLRIAKEAAIRRASINYPPMVSHFQLLYALALSLCSRTPLVGVSEPRSSRLKGRMRGEGEVMVKEIFVENVIETNDLLGSLINKGSSCIVLPQNHESPLCSNSHLKSQLKMKPRLSLGLCSREEALEASRIFPSNDAMSISSCSLENEKESAVHSDGLLDQGLLSCVTCGILSFTCVAVVQPREAAAVYLMSADCGFLDDHNIGSGENSNGNMIMNWKRSSHDSGPSESHVQERPNEEAGHCSTFSARLSNHNVEDDDSDAAGIRGASALALLASAYGQLSDSENDELPPKSLVSDFQNGLYNGYSHCTNNYINMNEDQPSIMLDDHDDSGDSESSIKSLGDHTTEMKTGNFSSQPDASYGSAAVTENSARTSPLRNVDSIRKSSMVSVIERSDKDSSRMHVFCLEHALEVEKLLHPIGGVNVMILCHPDYPKIEEEAKSLADELETDYNWKDIDFREAAVNDLERIRKSLEDEESIPTSSDWAVKLGINLYYSANLSKSPLYNKQLPYNAVIYQAFGCNSPKNSPIKPKLNKRKLGRQKKIVVAGKWCGKVWMSNQVHPFLAHRNDAHEKKLAERQHSESDTDTKSEEVETEIINKRIVSKKNTSGDNIRSGKRKKQPLTREIIKKPRIIKGSDNEMPSRVLRSCRKLNSKYEPEEVQRTSRCLRRLKVKDEVKEEISTPRSAHKLNVKDEAKGPSTRLRTKTQPSKSKDIKEQNTKKKSEKTKATQNPEKEDKVGEFACNIEGCMMSFSSKHNLALHKKDICPEEGCGKKFFSHKYLVQHRKVHIDDRPLGCPWKGCKMRFKWAWARTEHIRVHTGDRPYICRVCSQTFRFVSDFSRHKRKTGHHLVKKGRR